MAAEHEVAGVRIEVSLCDQNYFFGRRQSVCVAVEPSRKWWCLWLCRGTTKSIDELRVTGHFTGPVLSPIDRSEGCRDSGNLCASAPWGYGWSVPPSYPQVEYEVFVKNGIASGTVTGVQGGFLEEGPKVA